MDQNHIPVLFEGELVGRAKHSGDGRVEVTLLYQPLIDEINKDTIRALSVGYVAVNSFTLNQGVAVLSNSEFTFDFNIDLSGKSIEDINMLRRALMRELSFLKRKNEKNYKRGEEVKPTRKILIMEEVLDQLWQQLVEARAARHEANGREV